MPRLIHRQPKYRRHATGQAVVTLSGRDVYLGLHGSPESHQEYDRLIAEWLSHGRTTLPASVSQPTGSIVAEILLAFFAHASQYYRQPDGSPSTEIDNFRDAVRPLVRLYDASNAAQFGPVALRTVRHEMINLSWSRNYINKQIRRVKQIFKWAVAHELIPPSVYHGLQAVEGLRAGRSGARETAPVNPVVDAHIQAVLPLLSPPLKALVELQLLTVMRPGEAIRMRGIDIDQTGLLWIYRPQRHKTQHHGHQREICLGPKGRNIVRGFLKPEPSAYLFSPADAVEWMRQRRRAARKTPLSCGNHAGTNRKTNPRRQPGQRYTVESYCKAITKACDKADVLARVATEAADDQRVIPRWHPHQLRHNAATRLRKEFGLEAARVILGHRSSAVTEIYAELDRGRAAEIMGRVG